MNLLKLNDNNLVKTVNLEEKRKVQKVVYTKSDNWIIAGEQEELYTRAMQEIEAVIEADGKITEYDYINKRKLTNYRIQYANNNRYIHIVDKASGYQYATISLGNEKLVSNEYRLFIIFNVLQRITCPNATIDCLKFCYANKAKNSVKTKGSTSRRARIKNTIFSMFENFAEIMNEVIEFIRVSTNRDTIFRFHESGDIYSRNYWSKIRHVLTSNEDLKFMFYTKSAFVLNELNEVNQMPNVAIRYYLDASSNWTLVKKCYDENILTFSAIKRDDAIELTRTVNKRYICNMKALPTCEDFAEIDALEAKLLEPGKKKDKKEIQAKINKFITDLIERKQKCTNCLKCFDKENTSIFVYVH